MTDSPAPLDVDEQLPGLTAPGTAPVLEDNAGDVPPAGPDQPRRRGRPKGSTTKTKTEAAPGTSKDKAPRTEAKGPGRPTATEALGKRTAKGIRTVADMVELIEPTDAVIIRAGADRLGMALADASETNPTLRRWLSASAKGGSWTEVGIAAAAILLPVAMHHNLIPALALFAPDTAEQAPA